MFIIECDTDGDMIIYVSEYVMWSRRVGRSVVAIEQTGGFMAVDDRACYSYRTGSFLLALCSCLLMSTRVFVALTNNNNIRPE